MKATLITILVAAVALWVGYTIGYHHGANDTFAIFRPHHFVSEVTTYRGTAINSSPETVSSSKQPVLKEPPQQKRNGHVNSYPDPATPEISK